MKDLYRKTPRFIVGSNPMVKTNRTFIIHTRQPRIIAEVFKFDNFDEQGQMDCKRKFETGAILDLPDGYYIFGALFVEYPEDKLPKIMRQMADWYEVYLKEVK